MQPLRIENPCTQRWSEMAREGAGRHCAACDRTVVDVRRATAAVLAAKAMIFGRDGHFCGHARLDAEGVVQLRVPKPAPRSSARSLAVATALALPLGCTETDRTFVTVGESPTPTQPATPEPPPSFVSVVASASATPTECARPETIGLDPPRVVMVAKGEMPIVFYIHFPSMSVALGKDDLDIVDETAKTLAEHPEITRLKITGHADNTENGPIELGMKRASVIVSLLVSKGIAASRLEAISAGSSMPIDANDSAEGRAANRRITFEAVR